jgi:uncharacterized protein YbaR (Trm112 family)
MNITFACPRCGQNLEVDASAGGMQVNCPTCQHPLVVPSTHQPPQLPEAGNSPSPMGTIDVLELDEGHDRPRQGRSVSPLVMRPGKAAPQTRSAVPAASPGNSSAPTTPRSSTRDMLPYCFYFLGWFSFLACGFVIMRIMINSLAPSAQQQNIVITDVLLVLSGLAMAFGCWAIGKIIALLDEGVRRLRSVQQLLERK